jgi:MFS family permease
MTYPINYFTWQGAKFGTLLGALAGLCFFPVVGILPGSVFGGICGLFTGFLVAIAMSVYYLFFSIPQNNLTFFRRRLVFSGILITLLAYGLALIPIFCLPAFLFDDWGFRRIDWRFWGMFLAIFFVPSIPFVILSSAYTFSRYADKWIKPLSRPKNDEKSSDNTDTGAYEGYFIWQFLARVKRFIPIIALGAVIVFGVLDYSSSRFNELIPSPFLQGIAAGICAVLYAFFTALILALLNSWLILCLNRIYFQEYVPHLTPEQYKRRLMWCAGIATFCASPILTFGLFLPLAVGIAVLTARTYAETYYQAGDKLKNDEKVKRAEAV